MCSHSRKGCDRQCGTYLTNTRPAEVFKIAQVNAPQEVPYCCSKRCSQGSVPWTVGETRRSEGTKIMAGADRRGLPAAVSVENATPHEVKLVVPVLNARRRFRLKRIEELMDRSLTEVRLRLGPKPAQLSSCRGKVQVRGNLLGEHIIVEVECDGLLSNTEYRRRLF